MAPLSGSAVHVVDFGTSWHGRLMVLGWGILLPVGILLGRFYKVTPAQDWPARLDNPFWFRSHRAVEYAAGVLMLAALALILTADPARSDWGPCHALMGWSLVVFGWVQLLGSHLRGTMGGPVEPFTRRQRPPGTWGGDHFDMSAQRIWFEYIHKILGYALVLLSVAALLSGLRAADALNWMWIAIALWWLAVAIAFAVLQRQGKAIDCYQAIWGVDPELPGNRRKTIIGWGVRRYTPETLARAPWPRRRT
jgi:hypothetical protein